MPHSRGLRFTAHCVCGDSIDVRSSHQDTIDFVESLWTKLHTGTAGGEQHGPATPSQAGRIRQRERSRQLSRNSGVSSRSEGTATGT